MPVGNLKKLLDKTELDDMAVAILLDAGETLLNKAVTEGQQAVDALAELLQDPELSDNPKIQQVLGLLGPIVGVAAEQVKPIFDKVGTILTKKLNGEPLTQDDIDSVKAVSAAMVLNKEHGFTQAQVDQFLNSGN